MSAAITPLTDLKVARGFRCADRRCACIHFICPGCGEEGSVFVSQTTSVFSATCGENGEEFLVDSRGLFTIKV